MKTLFDTILELAESGNVTLDIRANERDALDITVVSHGIITERSRMIITRMGMREYGVKAAEEATIEHIKNHIAGKQENL